MESFHCHRLNSRARTIRGRASDVRTSVLNAQNALPLILFTNKGGRHRCQRHTISLHWNAIYKYFQSKIPFVNQWSEHALGCHQSTRPTKTIFWDVKCIVSELVKRLSLARTAPVVPGNGGRMADMERTFHAIFIIKSKCISSTILNCWRISTATTRTTVVAHISTRVFTRENQIKYGFDWEVNNLTWTNLWRVFWCVLKTILICLCSTRRSRRRPASSFIDTATKIKSVRLKLNSTNDGDGSHYDAANAILVTEFNHIQSFAIRV